MKHTFLDKLVCPFDHHDLLLKAFKENEEEIIEGLLTCDHCNRYYPIIQGIPIMSPDEYREINFEIPLLERWGEQPMIKDGLPAFELSTERQLGHRDT